MKDLERIIDKYESVVKGVEMIALREEQRAYGGVVRATKGTLVEDIAKDLVRIAWKDLGLNIQRLSTGKKSVKIPINREYIEKIKSPEVRQYIKNNIKKFYYPMKTDVHVFVDNEFVLAIECKSYTENAMPKRILVDFTLLKQV